MARKIEWLDDAEYAKYLRISVRTLVRTLKRDGNVGNVSPRYIGSGYTRKQRRWSASSIAKSDGVGIETVLEAIA